MAGEHDRSATDIAYKSNRLQGMVDPEWMSAIKEWLLHVEISREVKMSRDMTLFVDDDQKPTTSTLLKTISRCTWPELTDDYLGYTGNYIRIEPGGHNEAPGYFQERMGAIS